MLWLRWLLIGGGIFNCTMGLIFFSNRLLQNFLQAALSAEQTLFHRLAFLPFPQNPVHLLLIHGFGAAAMILGATLIVSSQDPRRYLPFILFDALGRLLFGSLMVLYVLRFSLLRLILIFGILELIFGAVYLLIVWKFAD
jgi:hypothetical protein